MRDKKISWTLQFFNCLNYRFYLKEIDIMKKIFVLLIAIILLFNCASTKKGNKNQAIDEGGKGIIHENFDPLILNDDDIIVKKSKSVNAQSDYDESMIRNEEETKETETIVDGYRVQICALADKEAARDIQREAIIKFNENIYLTYDSPYYKVRVGDCATRFDADKLQRLATEKGFDDAWVVKTKVKLNPETKEKEGREEESPKEQ